jgi:2-aminobenzoate-CoA ligase
VGTAHVDTFARDHLPPRSAWPDLLLDELSYPDELNAAAVLLGEPRFEARACVVGEGETWTYAELCARAEAVAAALAGEGLVPGNRVLLHGPNSRSPMRGSRMWCRSCRGGASTSRASRRSLPPTGSTRS